MILDEKDLDITIISKPGLSVASLSFKRDNFEIPGYDTYSKKKVDFDGLVDAIQNGKCVLVRIDRILSNFDMFNFWLKVVDLLLKKGVPADKIMVCNEISVLTQNYLVVAYNDNILDRLILTNHFETDSVEIRVYTLGVLTYIKWCGAYSLDNMHSMYLEIIKYYVFANADCLLKQVNNYFDTVGDCTQKELFYNEISSMKLLKSVLKCGGCTHDIINFNYVMSALKMLVFNIDSSVDSIADKYTKNVARKIFRLIHRLNSIEQVIPSIGMLKSDTSKMVLAPVLSFYTSFMYSSMPYCREVVAIRRFDGYANNTREHDFNHIIDKLYTMYNAGCYVKEFSWTSSSFVTLDKDCDIDKIIGSTLV